MPEKFTSVVHKFLDEYMQNTPKKLKIIDAYLFYILLTGVFQFLYCALVGTFPFNSFLSGFISSVGSFVLAGKTVFVVEIYSSSTALLKQIVTAVEFWIILF